MIYRKAVLCGKARELCQTFYLRVILSLLKPPSLKFRLSYLYVYVAVLFVGERTRTSSDTIFQTTFHRPSGLFPFRHWYLITTATFQHFQLSLYWLTLLNICQHVYFLLDDMQIFWSKYSGNSITVDCWEASLLTANNRTSWSANEKPCVSTFYLANVWCGPGGEISMVVLAKKLTSENKTTV